jgi:MFS family permease
MRDNEKIYRGWIVAFASFISYAVVWGAVWYSFSVFYNIFVRDYQWGRGVTAGVFTLCVGIIFLSGPLVGRLLDRYGPSRVLPWAAFFLAINLFLCSSIDSLIGFYAFYGVGCALGMSFLLFTPQATIISRWFDAYRGTAMGFSLSGAGIGMMIFVPAVQWVTSQWTWRAGFFMLGGLVLLLVFPVNLFLARFPAEGELEKEKGFPLLSFLSRQAKRRALSSVAVDPAWAAKVWTPKEALQSPRFWYLCLAGMTGTALVVQTIFSHFILITTEEGYSAALSSKMLGLAGMMGTLGFVFWGRLSDRVGREWGYTLGTSCLFVGLSCLLLMHWFSVMPLFLAFAVLFGFGYGSRAPLTHSIWADVFQGPHFASIFGMYQTSLVVGVTGPWIAGVVSESFDSYKPIILFLMGSVWLSCLFVWLAGPRHIRRVKRVRTG